MRFKQFKTIARYWTSTFLKKIMLSKFCVKCGEKVYRYYHDDTTGFVLCCDCYFGDDEFETDDYDSGEDDEEEEEET